MRKALNQEPTGTMYEEQERQKMLRLNRDNRDQQEPRLEWIYSGDRAQSEDYLLGKKFDSDKNSDPVPETTITSTSTIDLANKIREDPLYLIKKREIEQRKRILENPVRLQQLKELVERQEVESVVLNIFNREIRFFSRRSSSHKKKARSRSRSRSRDRHQRHHQRHRRSASKSPPRHRRRSPSPAARSKRERTPPSRSVKLSKEERERRVREMLVDGALRNEQRQKNVRTFKEHDERQEKLDQMMREKHRKRNDGSSSDDDEQHFIRPMIKQVIDDPSLKRRDLKHYQKRR